ncbi:hypothetical protein WT24_14175 [Burkholderia sp. MSMB1078WGS]|nr:hypothetical protein WT24_14175 [Burkholderia sp. MSMB1078WGS]
MTRHAARRVSGPRAGKRCDEIDERGHNAVTRFEPRRFGRYSAVIAARAERGVTSYRSDSRCGRPASISVPTSQSDSSAMPAPSSAAALARRVFRTIQAPLRIFAAAPGKLRGIACRAGRSVHGRARARFVTEIA